jgi:DnaK suppressor protein
MESTKTTRAKSITKAAGASKEQIGGIDGNQRPNNTISEINGNKQNSAGSTLSLNAENGKERTRYSDAELSEFKDLIVSKLDDAKREAQNLQDMLRRTYDNGTDDTARTFKNLEESSDTLAKEELGQMVSRQQKFVEQLEGALIRIETKTYGICHITGKLIPKERLRIVPHTTQSIEAKLSMER